MGGNIRRYNFVTIAAGCAENTGPIYRTNRVAQKKSPAEAGLFLKVGPPRLELGTCRLTYHYSFRYPCGLWSGLSLHLHHYMVRWAPSSLYTFLHCGGLARDWQLSVPRI